MTRPLLVCTDRAAAAAAVERLREQGWTVVDGWSPAGDGWSLATARIACVGVVASEGDARVAVLAAARGAGVVAVVDEDEGLASCLFDELSRCGRARVEDAPPGVAAALAPEARTLLRLLADGETVGDAARALFVSRRTAVRRLARAREALGVRTNAEAVLRATGRGTPRP